MVEAGGIRGNGERVQEYTVGVLWIAKAVSFEIPPSKALRQSLIISQGGLDIFVSRSLALTSFLIALLLLLFPLIPSIRTK
jgi:hypothetical protein